MSGQHKSEMTGIYRLFFSNEHSWFHVLKIRYRIQSNLNKEEE